MTISELGMIYNPSIINNVLGPITLGPSSSHMAGPVRLGRLALEIIDFQPKKVEIIYNKGSSFAETYKAHLTDCAMIAGLIGWNPDNLKIPQVYEEAENRGLKIKISIKSIATEHPNCVIFKIYGENGKQIDIMGNSEGGGAIRIYRINEQEVDLDGQSFMLLISLRYKSGEAQKRVLTQVQKLLGGANLRYSDGRVLTVELEEGVSSEKIEKILTYSEVEQIKYLKPVFLYPKRGASHIPLFKSGAEILKMSEESNIKLSEIGLRYEMNRLGLSKVEIKKQIEKMVYVMKNALIRGLSENLNFRGGIVKQGGKRLIEAYRNGKTLCSGTLPKAIAYAMAVNEVSVSSGLIVAAPTAGASGVLPGALFAAAEELKIDENVDFLIDGLLCAGAVGAIFAQRATFLAELCGCQVETGAASAMASAAVVEMKGGTVKQSLDAASITIQNILGMECNPVGGLMGVPCINRNALGAVNALMSAEIVLAGVESVIPYDEVVDIAYKVGKNQPAQCTAKGGLAITPTGLDIMRHINGGKYIKE